MAGLLDLLTGGGDPAKQQGLLNAAAALLQAGQPSRVPTSTMLALNQAQRAYQGGQDDYNDRKRQQTLYDLRLKGLQGELDDQDAARKKRSALDQAARDSLQTPGMQALALGGGPTPANAARIGDMNGGFDTEGYINRVLGIDPMQGLQLAQSLKKAAPKFDAGITWVNGPDGKPVAVRTAEDGSVKQIEGLSPRDKLELANLGGRDVAYNPFALQAGQTFQRTMTPGEVASNQIGLANLGISRARLALDQQQAGKPVFNAEAGGFVLPPSIANPTGKLLPVAGVGGKSPTEFQGKSAAFGLRATEADKILRNLDGQYSAAGVNLKNALGDVWGVGGALGAGANALLSDSSQQVDQAQRDFVNAVLRQESGAAIGAGEFDNAAKQYFPQPGDSQAVKAQKARNRALAIQGLQANAGRAAMSAPVATGGWSITKVE